VSVLETSSVLGVSEKTGNSAEEKMVYLGWSVLMDIDVLRGGACVDSLKAPRRRFEGEERWQLTRTRAGAQLEQE